MRLPTLAMAQQLQMQCNAKKKKKIWQTNKIRRKRRRTNGKPILNENSTDLMSVCIVANAFGATVSIFTWMDQIEVDDKMKLRHL